MLIEFDTKHKSWHNNTTAPSAYPKKIGAWIEELMLKFSINNKLEKWEIILAVDYIIRRGRNIH